MFSLKEIIEIAVNVEENGEKFYRNLSKLVEKDKQKKIFEYLADQEVEHAKVFKKLGEEFRADQEDYIQTDEVDAYLRNYIEGKVFPSLDTMLKKVKGMSFEDIIDYAIQIEKDTIIFYTEILKLIKNETSRKMVNAIIEQEKKHVLDLMNLKENIV